ncbi:MAG: helix-turn-helix transcriptional regulator [Oscillospiraceae bacterium]|nr:helix-turn-helix transcriptional regulator [Oscillospiraceae bacterium]
MKTAILLKDRVFQLRKQAGMSQQQLGEVLGLTHKSISMLESGGRSTTIDKLVILAEYFHVSTDYLLGITDDPAWRGAPLEEHTGA